MKKLFGRKQSRPSGWQVGDPAETNKGLEQPMPRFSSCAVKRQPGVNQVEQVRAAIEEAIGTRGYCSLAMQERVFINVYFGVSGMVAGPETQWRVVSPRDWVTVIVGLEHMGQKVAADFVKEIQQYKATDVRNADGELDHFEGLREIMTRWAKVPFDRSDVLQRYLERDYWGVLVD